MFFDEIYMMKKVLWKCLDKVRINDDDLMIEVALHHCNDSVNTLMVPSNYLIDDNHQLVHHNFVHIKQIQNASYIKKYDIEFQQVCITVPLKM